MNYKILSIIDSLNPKDGGPSHSILDMALANKNNGIIHDIIYLGKEVNFKKLAGIKIIPLNDSYFKYGLSYKLIKWLFKNRNKYDLFILHGLWQFITLLSRLILPLKYVVFTHGMLDPYFGRNKFKSFKKKIYWYLVEKRNLQKAKYVLLNSSVEEKQIKKTFVNTDGIKFKKVNYGIFPKKINSNTNKKKFYLKFSYLKKKKIILYIGRIHPKKGLDKLIDALVNINDQNYILLIAGDTSNNYAQSLKKKIIDAKLKDKVIFANFLSGDLKWGAIAAAESTILPSHGENFGVAVVESLFMGTPVICSNKVGIYKKIKEYNAGIITGDNASSLTKGIKKILALSYKAKKNMKKKSLACFSDNFNIKSNNEFSEWLKSIL